MTFEKQISSILEFVCDWLSFPLHLYRTPILLHTLLLYLTVFLYLLPPLISPSLSAHVPVALLVEPDSNYPSVPACFCLNLRDSFEYLKCFYESLPERNPLLSITAVAGVGMKIPVQTQALEMRIIPLASMLPICQTNFRCAMLDWLLKIQIVRFLCIVKGTRISITLVFSLWIWIPCFYYYKGSFRYDMVNHAHKKILVF